MRYGISKLGELFSIKKIEYIKRNGIYYPEFTMEYGRFVIQYSHYNEEFTVWGKDNDALSYVVDLGYDLREILRNLRARERKRERKIV